MLCFASHCKTKVVGRYSVLTNGVCAKATEEKQTEGLVLHDKQRELRRTLIGRWAKPIQNVFSSLWQQPAFHLFSRRRSFQAYICIPGTA
jgi:hypothetical protein